MAEQGLQDVYATSGDRVRASFGRDARQAAEYYRPLVDFVRLACPPAVGLPLPRLLDVGCGSGWSTYTLSQAGYDAVGLDLNAAAFEAPPGDTCRLMTGSATDIPFPDDSFDVVDCFQCLEHVPDPRRALDEMTRVCRPGGAVVILGPNLVTPVPGLSYTLKPSSWKTLRLFRRAGMPRHPFGNTLPEIAVAAVWRALQIAGKLARRTPHFSMRTPDLTPPFFSDNDACYLCNPIDLAKYFRSRGFKIVQNGKPGRPGFARYLAGGTWVAARKP